MVAGDSSSYGLEPNYSAIHQQQQQHHRQIESPGMLLSESKYFPGHPTISPGPFSPTFSRKDIFNQRKQREFIPENKKDDSYWDRRRRNNEAAKRSREKRRLNDMLLETRVLELTKDNHILQAQLAAIYEKYGIRGETMICMERVLATLPTNDQVLNFTKKRVGSTGGGSSCGSASGHLSGMVSPAPSPLSFQSLALPLLNNNNNNNNNGGGSSNNNNNNTLGLANNNHHHHMRPRSCSPSPPRCYSPASEPTASTAAVLASPYTDIRAYAETGHMYRRPLLSSSSSSSVAPRCYEDDQSDDKDSGLALNLSTDRAGSSSDGGRSSVSGSPPVAVAPPSLLMLERESSCSSGDESGYPRSPNSAGESSAGCGNSPNSSSSSSLVGSLLPHKLRFKSPPAVSEKEAVSSLLSLHQMAMIKREPVDHINHWMERMEAAAAAGAAGGGGANFFASLLPRPDAGLLHHNHHRRDAAQLPGGGGGGGEPLLKRARPENLTDEVARLTSEVATLKNILVNRMKEERSDEGED